MQDELGNADQTKKQRIRLLIIYSFIILVLLLLIFFIFAISKNLVANAMFNYNNNSTLAGMYITSVNNFLIFCLTLMYVIFTLDLVTQSEKSVKKSEEAVAQSRKEQRIRDIENRLEKFYIPASDILNDNRKQDIIKKGLGK